MLCTRASVQTAAAPLKPRLTPVLQAQTRRSTPRRLDHTVSRWLVPDSSSSRALLRVIFVPAEPNGFRALTSFVFVQSRRYTLALHRPTVSLKLSNVVTMASGRAIKDVDGPVPYRPISPAPPLALDFARQQVSKQQRSNFHSTSISPLFQRTSSKMVSSPVNKTNLHPSGVQYVLPSPSVDCI
jgi:hypothetical protein